MKNLLRWSTALLVYWGFSSIVVADDVASLRGGTGIADSSLPAEIQQLRPESAPLARDYVQQPPLIPHKTENYQVNLKVNKCLTCHSWSNYKKAKATKISPTHFRNRDGIEMANVAPRRYFCTQCHVPQADSQPLVENTFQSVDVLQPQ